MKNLDILNEELSIDDSDKELILKEFSDTDAVQAIIDKVRVVVENFEHDISTAKGKKETASLSRKVSSLKTKLDGLGKDLVSDWKSKAKTVDENRKLIRDQLDELRDLARKPLTDFEEKEKARVDRHEQEVSRIKDFRVLQYECIDSMRSSLNELKELNIDDRFEEFQDRASRQKDESIAHLENIIFIEESRIEAERIRKEKEQIERERQQKEAIEKAAKEAAEMERIKAESKLKEEKARAERELLEERQRREKATRDAEAAEKRRIEAEEAAKIKAEKDRVNAEIAAKEAAEKAKIEAERQKQLAVDAERIRIQEEQRQAQIKKEEEEAERKKAESRRNHLSKKRTEAKEFFIGSGFSEEDATNIVKAIIKCKTGIVCIDYSL